MLSASHRLWVMIADVSGMIVAYPLTGLIRCLFDFPTPACISRQLSLSQYDCMDAAGGVLS